MDVLMPQLGETVAEGKITKWFKSAGDAVKPGDNLFEIETDKVSMEVPSTSAGVLSEIRVGVGEVALVGAIVAVIAGAGGVAAPAPAAATPPRQESTLAPRTSPSPTGAAAAAPIKLDQFFEVRTPDRNYGPAKLPSGAVVTPLARRLATDAGIDLARVTGSGPHGRIVARDVASTSRDSASHARRALVPAAGAGEVMAFYRDVAFVEVLLDGMRKTIAARLMQAKQTIPHFYLTADVEIGRFLAMREEANVAAPKDKDGNPAFKLSVNDIIIK